MDIRAAFVVVAMLILPSGDARAQDPGRPPVEITLDTGQEVATEIGPRGGKLELNASDGSTYVLTVPPGALLSTEWIQMRPITAVVGLPGKPAIAGGVAFEPKGLEFLLDAMLSIEPGKPVAADHVPMLWGFVGEGRAPTLVPHRFDNGRYLRPIDHFSGEILAGEWWRHVKEPDYQKELDDAVRAGEEEARRIFQDTVEQAGARVRVVGLRADMAREFAAERACQLEGRADCAGIAADRLEELARNADKGLVEPAIRALGQPDATCQQAINATQLLLGNEREWQLVGVRDGTEASTPWMDMPIDVEVDGRRETMSAAERVFQLCRRESVSACGKNANIGGMVVELLAAERQRQLLGLSALTPEMALLQAGELLGCTEALAERCFNSGDYQPLMQLSMAVALARDYAGGAGGEHPVLKAGQQAIEDHLRACARYRVSWTHVSIDTWRTADHAVEEETVRGNHAATVSYEASITPGGIGRLTGEGPANFTECSARLLKATDFLSIAAVSPCRPVGPFRAEIAGMDLRKAGRPAVTELRVEIPTAFLSYRSCWRFSGCNEYEMPTSGGLNSFLLFQSSRHPAYGTVSSWQIVRNLKEPMNSPYPVLFRGEVHLTGTPPGLDVHVLDDRAEIVIEHIGRQ
ncbi:MAG: hypothetical protein WAT70_11795 [Rhizobiaceae bacterium]